MTKHSHSLKRIAFFSIGLITLIILAALYIVNDTNDPNLLITGVIVILLSIGIAYFSLNTLNQFMPVARMM